MKLNDTLMCQGVKRWHIVDMSRSQSVAEHSFNVAFIAGEFFNALGHEADKCAAVMVKALVHDADEVFLGDVPAVAKKEPKPKDRIEDRAVQLADKLEAYWFAHHYAIGPRREFVVMDTAKRYHDLKSLCCVREQLIWETIERSMGVL